MAGALYMNYMGFIDPHVVFSLHDYSVMAILVAIVGGVGTIYGPTIGAFIMVAFQEVFRTGFFGLFDYLGKATDPRPSLPCPTRSTRRTCSGSESWSSWSSCTCPTGSSATGKKIKRNVFRINPAR